MIISMKRFWVIYGIVWIFFCGAKGMVNSQSLTDLSAALPPGIQGWQKFVPESVYGPDNLFEYIDGGAELYLSYQFRQLLALVYTREGFPEIKVDIFDMGNAANAFGVFSHSRESVDEFVAPRVESEYASGLLTFWKGKYYISILAYPETDEQREVIKALARQLATTIKEDSPKPGIVSRLPIENLLPGSVRYFRHYIWLNSHYFISDQNILDIDDSTEAVLAKYNGKEKNGSTGFLILLVAYPDQKRAQRISEGFFKTFLPGAKDGFKQLENGRWTGCQVTGPLLKIVFNAPGIESARQMLNKIK